VVTLRVAIGSTLNHKEKNMPRTMTISEGLAEIKTIAKRIEKKREFVRGFLFRQDQMRDPLEKEGGSFERVRAERQAIADLLNEVVKIRSGIVRANSEVKVTINGTERSIADWLVWRRDVSKLVGECLGELQANLKSMRAQAQQKGLAVIGADKGAQAASDIIVNVNESELLKEVEAHEQTLGTLDGALSTINATNLISV
jgi:hypothetical protein